LVAVPERRGLAHRRGFARLARQPELESCSLRRYRKHGDGGDAGGESAQALDSIAPGVKIGAGWLAEKLGRLKLNGRLLEYSPLSHLIERADEQLEGLDAHHSRPVELMLAEAV
jgi:hypothetical protein